MKSLYCVVALSLLGCSETKIEDTSNEDSKNKKRLYLHMVTAA